MKLILPAGFALSLLACTNSTTGISACASEAYPDLDRAFVADVEPPAPSKQMDLRDIALTLPIFEVSPDLRHEWVYHTGIEQRTNRTIHYKCDGACPAPAIKLLSTDDPIRIEVSFSDSSFPVRYYYERGNNGWKRLSRYPSDRGTPNSEQIMDVNRPTAPQSLANLTPMTR